MNPGIETALVVLVASGGFLAMIAIAAALAIWWPRRG